MKERTIRWLQGQEGFTRQDKLGKRTMCTSEYFIAGFEAIDLYSDSFHAPGDIGANDGVFGLEP